MGSSTTERGATVLDNLDVPRVPYQKVEELGTGGLSNVIRARVEVARQIQSECYAPLDKPYVLVNDGSSVTTMSVLDRVHRANHPPVN